MSKDHEEYLKQVDTQIKELSEKLVPQISDADAIVEEVYKQLVDFEKEPVKLETELARVKPATVNNGMAAINNRLTSIGELQIKVTQFLPSLRKARTTLRHLLKVKAAKIETGDRIVSRQDQDLRKQWGTLHCVDEEGLLASLEATIDNMREAIDLLTSFRQDLGRTTQDIKYQHKIIAKAEEAQLLGQGVAAQNVDEAVKRARMGKKNPMEVRDAFDDLDLPDEIPDEVGSEEEPADENFPDASAEEVTGLPTNYEEVALEEEIAENETETETKKQVGCGHGETLGEGEGVQCLKCGEWIPGPEKSEEAEDWEGVNLPPGVTKYNVLRAIGVPAEIAQLKISPIFMVNKIAEGGPGGIRDLAKRIGYEPKTENYDYACDYIRVWGVSRDVVIKEKRKYNVGPEAENLKGWLQEAADRLKQLQEEKKNTGSEDEIMGDIIESLSESTQKDFGLSTDITDIEDPLEDKKEEPVAHRQLDAKADENVDLESLINDGLPEDLELEPKLAKERDQELVKETKKKVEQEKRAREEKKKEQQAQKEEEEEDISKISIDDLLGFD